MKCLDCGKRKEGSKNAECWTYQKCGMCYHHKHKVFPTWKDTRPFRMKTRPTDLYLDKGMARAIQEIEKL